MRCRTSRWIKALLAAAPVAVLGLTLPAQAELVFDGNTDLTGTGFGTTDPILVLDVNGQATTESGTSSVDASTNPVNTGDAQSQGQARDIGGLITRGISSPHDLGIVFDTNEPDNDAERSVTLTDLSITIYSGIGEALFTATYPGSDLTLDPINPGTGGSGYLFRLTDAQADQAALFWNNGHYLGASATVDNVAAGAESFFAINAPENVIPEPGSVALLGLGGLLLLARRRTA